MKKLTRKQQHAKLLREARKNYEINLAIQKGVCAICKKPPKKGQKLHNDHDHGQMVLRGLLHSWCNRNLRRWMNPEWLRAAAEYLENPPLLNCARAGNQSENESDDKKTDEDISIHVPKNSRGPDLTRP